MSSPESVGGFAGAPSRALKDHFSRFLREATDLDRVQSQLREIDARVEYLASLLTGLAGNPATERLEALYSLLAAHNETTWDSDRKLHDTLMRRLATIERAVRKGVSPSGARADAATASTTVRDFLGQAVDTDPPAVELGYGKYTVEVPARDTVILPWVSDHGEWEPLVAAYMQAALKPGSVALDIGAHVGLFSLIMAEAVGTTGRVLAIEADPLNARFLRRNLTRAQYANVLVLELAASDTVGTVPLSRSPDESTGDSRAYDVPTSGQLLNVASVPLDEVVVGRVDFIKVDLEGTDHVALRGLQRTIQEFRPTIVTEFWPRAIRDYGDEPADVLAWFRSLGYRWHALEDETISEGKPDDFTCSTAEASPTGFYNLVLNPRDR